MIKQVQSKTDQLKLLSLFNSILASPYKNSGFETWTNEKIENSILSSLVFVEEREGAFAGFVILRNIPDGFEIDLLGTNPAFRQQGVMVGLLNYIKLQLVKGQKLWLEVHENNQIARKLYSKQGFIEVGKRPRYYKDGGACIYLEYIL